LLCVFALFSSHHSPHAFSRVHALSLVYSRLHSPLHRTARSLAVQQFCSTSLHTFSHTFSALVPLSRFVVPLVCRFWFSFTHSRITFLVALHAQVVATHAHTFSHAHSTLRFTLRSHCAHCTWFTFTTRCLLTFAPGSPRVLTPLRSGSRFCLAFSLRSYDTFRVTTFSPHTRCRLRSVWLSGFHTPLRVSHFTSHGSVCVIQLVTFTPYYAFLTTHTPYCYVGYLSLVHITFLCAPSWFARLLLCVFYVHVLLSFLLRFCSCLRHGHIFSFRLDLFSLVLAFAPVSQFTHARSFVYSFGCVYTAFVLAHFHYTLFTHGLVASPLTIFFHVHFAVCLLPRGWVYDPPLPHLSRALFLWFSVAGLLVWFTALFWFFSHFLIALFHFHRSRCLTLFADLKDAISLRLRLGATSHIHHWVCRSLWIHSLPGSFR